VPTKKQLQLIWEAQLEFFGGSGLPKQTYVGGAEDNGLTMEKEKDIPLVSKRKSSNSKGDKVGKLVYDKEHKGLKIIT
jgi:hypothetical protein